MTDPQSTTHFGFRDVPTAAKQKLVGQVFTSVAKNYDLMNDLMSFGIHRLWKRHFVAMSGIRKGDKVLDLAGGTGDIAALLKPVVGKDGEVIVGDINAAMLGVGRDRLTDRGIVAGLEWAQLNAERLPFADNTFDAVTMAFGLRNVTDKDQALADICRVLKPGGRALILEFSKVRNPVFNKLYDFHSFQVLPRLGKLFAHDADSYQYLAESIRKHPDQATLKGMMERAGFGRVEVRNLSNGIVAIHRAYKY
ncbi:MAG TPA: bifunctional demethylmenaquinone methyltransferase/2-methoxy-6-polyprenyl-1,4-benzoquinol methylase UbiE [Gammaproteobacteria bacterium]|nr:bifunctional demethylmenaquinone methyltransferase/2-methoxy-6-polyprenyl-1,4-benzoquinol methylase UbiE [Gammaproteobacteria bacterium]